MSPLLQVEDLKIHFPAGRNADGSPRVVHAVDGLSFSVEQGKSFGIVGESGSGKSTAALGIMRLVDITQGTIRLGSDDLTALKGQALREARKRFQMVFQDPFSSLNPRKRAGAAIREPLDLMSAYDMKMRDEVVAESLISVGLHPSASRLFPHQFSGGQRQRLCIARALATQPELLVCDEPVSALDVAIQAQVINLLLRLQDQLKLSYVFISHDLAVVQHLCDAVGVMYLGQFAERGSARQIFSNPRHPYTWSLMAAALKPEAGQRHRERRTLIKGEPPSPIDLPKGCRFATRCPFAQERCRAEAPALREIETGHAVACHFADSLEAPLPELRAA